MTPEQRRAKIMSLLSQCRIDETERLHSGRATIPAQPIAYYAEKIEALFAPPLFEYVMRASAAYVTRFDGYLVQEGAIAKFQEESEEFIEAVEITIEAANGSSYKESPEQLRRAAIGEWVDTMVTGGGVLTLLGVTSEELNQAMRDTLDKLSSRTTQDYVWDETTKTVMKRSKLEAKS